MTDNPKERAAIYGLLKCPICSARRQHLVTAKSCELFADVIRVTYDCKCVIEVKTTPARRAQCLERHEPWTPEHAALYEPKEAARD